MPLSRNTGASASRTISATVVTERSGEVSNMAPYAPHGDAPFPPRLPDDRRSPEGKINAGQARIPPIVSNPARLRIWPRRPHEDRRAQDQDDQDDCDRLADDRTACTIAQRTPLFPRARHHARPRRHALDRSLRGRPDAHARIHCRAKHGPSVSQLATSSSKAPVTKKLAASTQAKLAISSARRPEHADDHGRNRQPCDQQHGEKEVHSRRQSRPGPHRSR